MSEPNIDYNAVEKLTDFLMTGKGRPPKIFTPMKVPYPRGFEPEQCIHCTNPATQDGLCYPHYLATHHKGITMYELRNAHPESYADMIEAMQIDDVIQDERM